jgi:hypothetical protein
MVNIRQNQTRQCTICVVDFPIETSLAGGFNHLEKYSQWEGLSHILWKIKNVPNHQPAI